MASHSYTAIFLRQSLLANGRLISWCPGNYAGFPLFQFYFPLPFLTMVALSFAIPLEIAFKLVTVAGALLLPLAAFWCLRFLKVPFPGPALGAVFTLPFLFSESQSMWGGNLLSLLAGEFNYQIAFALGILFIGSLWHGFITHKRLVFNAILFGFIGLTHGVGFVFCGCMALFWFIRRPSLLADRAYYLALVYGIGIGIMAFWFLPFIEGMKWSTQYNEVWAVKLTDIFPKILWPYLIASVFGSALTFYMYIKRTASRKLLHHLGYLWFAVAVVFCLYQFGFGLNVINIRFLPFIEFLPLLILAILAGTLASYLKSAKLLLSLFTLATFYWVHEHSSKTPVWSAWNYSGYEAKQSWQEFKAINERLKGNASAPRVVFEHSPQYDAFGSIRAFENLPLFSGRSTMEGLYLQSSISAPFVFYLQSEISKIASVPLPQYDYTFLNLSNGIRHFQLWNIGHFVTVSDEVKNMARQIPSLKHVASYDIVDLFKVGNPHPGYVEPFSMYPVVCDIQNWRPKAYRWHRQYTPQTPFLLFASPRTKRQPPIIDLPFCDTPARISSLPALPIGSTPPVVSSVLSDDTIQIHTSQPGWPLLVKVSYHPNWKCQGAAGPFLISPSFMAIFPTQHDITMVFARSHAEMIGPVITLASLGLCLILGCPTHRFNNLRKRILRLRLNKRSMRRIISFLRMLVLPVLFTLAIHDSLYNQQRLKTRAEKAYGAGWLKTSFWLYSRLEQVSGETGGSDKTAFYRGLIRWQQHKPREALPFFERIANETPDSLFAAESLYHVGLCKQALGLDGDACLAWRRVQTDYSTTDWAKYATERIEELRHRRNEQ